MLKFIIGLLCGVACYFILADVFRIPYIRTSKAINNLAKNQQEKTSSIDIWLGNIASFIAKHLPMNEFKKQELKADLETAQMNTSPEMFTANAIVKALIVGIFAIPVYFFAPIMSPIILVLAFILYRMNVKGVSNRIRAKREKIENDLPRLVSTIEKTLVHNRSILDILQSFTKCACPELKYELDIVIADMHSGNEEAAIKRLETRVGSPMMNDVCRGFDTLIHGDSALAYWSSLAMKFSEIQRQKLKIEAEKVPRKVKRLSMCLLGCFMLIYVVVIVSQIMTSVGVMFG